MNEIIKTDGTSLTNVNVRTAFENAYTAIRNAGNNSKALCIEFLKLRDCPDLKAEFPTLDFKAIVDRYFGGEYSGATAYKYAQVAETYSNIPEFWESLTVGKMIILVRLENKKATNRSTPLFMQYVGTALNDAVHAKHEEWAKDNNAILIAIKTAEETGGDVDSLKKFLTPEPKDWKSPEAPGYAKYLYDIGKAAVISMSDKQLKETVKTYIEENPTDKERETAVKRSAKQSAPETPENLAWNAYSAMQAYISTLDKVPPEYQKALAKLEKEAENA